MWRWKFESLKAKNPESRIWKRTWEYQKARDDLVKTLRGDTTYEEKMWAYMDYIIEKTFSLDPLSERDIQKREFAVDRLWTKKDVNKIIKKITDKLRVYADRINYDTETKYRAPKREDLNAYIAWKKLFDYIVEEKHVYDAKFPTLWYHVEHFAKKMWIDLDGLKIH